MSDDTERAALTEKWTRIFQKSFRPLFKKTTTPDGVGLLVEKIYSCLAAQLEIEGNRCRTLERRLAEVESRPLKYVGPWDRNKNYTAGNLTTHGGSLWHANVASRSVVPGDACPAIWTLAVKKGRDAR